LETATLAIVDHRLDMVLAQLEPTIVAYDRVRQINAASHTFPTVTFFQEHAIAIGIEIMTKRHFNAAAIGTGNAGSYFAHASL
jgi:hypothetical protein